MRRLIAIHCSGDTLIATLDEASARTGLLIVSGGNEIRCGAHRGMALLATAIAGAGVPVLRYDRRGIGDSSGMNGGFLSAQEDLAAAVAAFRREMPRVARIVAFGNCDAATTLALFGRQAGVDRVLLANPWIVEDDDGMPPRAAIRARYLDRLRRPATLIADGVDLRKLLNGLRKLLTTRDQHGLADRVFAALADWGPQAQLLVATGDATALAFLEAARPMHLAIDRVETDSHSFAREADAAALRDWIMAGLTPEEP
jgi:exosortase A-associated hydrolase 1